MNKLPKLEHFEVERCFKPRDFGEVESCQLHLFSDASKVVYLRMVNNNGDAHCSFMMGNQVVLVKTCHDTKNGAVCRHVIH